VDVQGGVREMRQYLPYLGVVLPWIVVGMPVGLAIPILILDIPILDVPLYHKLVDVAVLLVVSLLLGTVFMAIDVRLGHVGMLHRCREEK